MTTKLEKMRANMKKLGSTAVAPESNQEMKKAQSVISYDSNYIEMDVPLAKVFRDPSQPRPEQEVLDDLPAFADRLEASGFVLAQLPLYYGFPDDTFQIIVGECRTEAFKMKGREFIKARVLKVPSKSIDPRKTLDLQWAENNDRKNLSMWAEAAFFKRYIDSFFEGNTPSDEDCFKYFGRSQRTVYTFLTLNKLDAAVTQFCKTVKINSAKNAEIIQACFNRVGESEFTKMANNYLAIDKDERITVKAFFRPLSLNAVSKTEEATTDTSAALNAASKTEEAATDTSAVLNAASKTEEATTDTSAALNATSKTEEATTDTSAVLNAVSKTEEAATGTSAVLNAVSKIEESTIIAGLDATIKDALLPLSGSIKKGINRVDKDLKVMSQLQGNHDLAGIVKTLKEMKTDISNLLDYINDYKKGAK